jgi:hypothetical protein
MMAIHSVLMLVLSIDEPNHDGTTEDLGKPGSHRVKRDGLKGPSYPSSWFFSLSRKCATGTGKEESSPQGTMDD